MIIYLCINICVYSKQHNQLDPKYYTWCSLNDFKMKIHETSLKQNT